MTLIYVTLATEAVRMQVKGSVLRLIVLVKTE